MDHYAPYQERTKVQHNIFQKPWPTEGILKSIGTKNKKFKKQIKSSNPHLTGQYTIYRSKLTHLTELSKQNYLKSMFHKYNNNAKKTWQFANIIITLKNNSKHKTSQRNRSNSKFKCDELNAFFSNVGKTISAKIRKPFVIYKHFLNQINFKVCF